jgi:hypothetical protein
MLVDFLALPTLAAYDLSSLQVIRGGGAAMPEAVAGVLRKCFQADPGRRWSDLGPAVESLKGDAERYAPDAVKAVQRSYSTVKDAMATKDYAGAVLFARDIPARAREANAAAAAAREALQKAWAEDDTSVTRSLKAAEGRIGALAHAHKLPRGMDKAALERAEASLASLRSGWAAASDQYRSGDVGGAVTRANQIRSQAQELEKSVGAP